MNNILKAGFKKIASKHLFRENSLYSLREAASNV